MKNKINYSENTNYKKIALCAITKNEEEYLVEFIEYYKSLGIDKIIIYDNNDVGNNNQYNILLSYIKDNIVQYIDYRGKHNCCQQLHAYTDCLNCNIKLFDYICFFDIDEFLHIGSFKNIKHLFTYNEKSFNNVCNICIPWKIYTDGNNIKNNKKLCLYRFNTLANNFHKNYKCFINCKYILLNKISLIDKKMSVHRGFKKLPTLFFNDKDIYIKHFYTKTIDECINKIHTGDVRFKNNDISRFYKIIKRFFTYNTINNEKINILYNAFPEYTDIINNIINEILQNKIE